MISYYFDDESGHIIAFDHGTRTLRRLSLIAELTPADAPTAELPLTATNKIPGAKGCPECGSPSRHKKDCSRSSNPPKHKAPNEGRACSLCGKAGHTRRTCGDNNEPQRSNRQSSPQAESMFKSAYDRVKMSASMDIPSNVIARELKLPLSEVNKAIISADYQDYIGDA